MRDIALVVLMFAGFVYAARSARGSTLVLLWIGFQRPYDFVWQDFWKSLPTWQIAFIICFFSNLARGELRPKAPYLLRVYLLLVAILFVNCIAAYWPERSFLFFNTYMWPTIFGLLLTFAAINDLAMLKKCLWVCAGGLAINAAKTGLVLAVDGGSAISQQISGFVGDNNVFALTLCLVLGMVFGLRRTVPKGLLSQSALYAVLAGIVLTIIFTKSRGAMVSLAVIAVTASLLSGKPVRYLLSCTAVATGFYFAVPPEYFGRLETLENVSADASAMGRVENWRLAWQAALDHPVFGIGMGNHIPYHVANGASTAHVAHSVYFQILGENGFPAIAVYLFFVVSSLVIFWRTWRYALKLAVTRPDLAWSRDFSFWLLCSYLGYVVGSAFLNMLFIEFPWYAVLLGSTLLPYLRLESDGVARTDRPKVARTLAQTSYTTTRAASATSRRSILLEDRVPGARR